MILYQSSLVGHIIGITLMAGAAFIDLAAFRAFWKVFRRDPASSALLANYLSKLQSFMGFGMLLILVSGTLMMIKLHAVWGAQLWFRIKMGVVLLVLINGLGLRRRLGSSFKRALTEQYKGNNTMGYLTVLRTRIRIVQAIQVFLFVFIYVLSVFKFN
jgi:hypothetical protein